MKKPNWVNPTRQAELVEMFGKFGNRCLLGHLNCPIKAHFRQVKPLVFVYAIPYQLPCIDTHGNKIKDSQGNQLYYTAYKVKRSIVENTAFNPVKYALLYDVKVKEQVHDWLLDDNQTNKAEAIARHKTNDRRTPLHGQFSAVSKDIFLDNQPMFYFEGLGINALTFRSFAKVRIASNFIRLHVDVADCFKALGKNAKHKAIRYGFIPKRIEQAIYLTCWLAVSDYLNI